MSRRTERILTPVMAVAGVALMASTAFASLTVKQTATTSGMMGLLNTEIKTVTYIQDEKKCDETETKMTSKVMKLMGGGKPIKTSSVVDLNAGTMTNIDHQRKTCTETPLSEIGEMAGAWAGGTQGDKSAMGDQKQFDTSKVTMEPPEITVNKTGESETIAGHNSEQYLVTMHVKGTDKESGEEFDFFVDMDLWIAKNVPGYEEFKAFNQRLIDEMGLGASSSVGGSMTSMLGMYGVDDDDLADRLAEIDGFPMRSIMKLKGAGGQFDEMNAGQTGEDGASEEESQAAAKTLKGLFGGGGDEDEEGEEGGDDAGYFMTVKTQVDELSTGSVSGDKFNCPNKYDVEKPKTKSE